MTGDLFIDWMVFCAAACFVLLAIGAAIAWLCPEPIDRIEVIRWTFAACLFVPLIQPLPGVPRFSLALLPATERRAVRAEGMDAPVMATLPIKATSNEAGVKRSAVEETPERMVGAVGGKLDLGAAGSVPEWSVWAWLKSLSLRQTLFLAVKIAYGFLLAGLLVNFLRGRFALERLAASAREADEKLLATMESIAPRRTGFGRQVRLLVSDEIAAPLMWGYWRPTILLPSRLLQAKSSPLTRYSLAHEWSHVVRHDYLALWIANLAKATCYVQPFYWALRRELLLCQDFLADAFAARQGEGAEDYSAFLLSLAHGRSNEPAAVVLGIRESRKSGLRRRIEALVEKSKPFMQQQRWSRSMRIQAIVLTLAALLVGLRITAKADDDKKQQGAITYDCRVIDRVTGAPIDGATVKITRSTQTTPRSEQHKVIEVTEHKTDAAGKYSFTLPPEQANDPALYLEAEAEHPMYQPMGRGGYGHGMIRKNLELGDPPFFAEIKLSHGEMVTATVLNPDGSPAAGVQVYANTRAGEEGNRLAYELGAAQRTVTDERGRFQVIVPTPGDGVIYVYPKDFAIVAKRIGGWRGELSTIHLQKGERLRGRVLNTNGEPVANIGVAARQIGGNADVDAFVSAAGIGNGVYRGTMTDAEGKFELRPLMPLGRFELNVANYASDSSEPRDKERRVWKPVEGNFSPVTVKIDRVNPEPIEIRAAPPLPLVTVRGRFFNSKGEPCGSHEQFFHGTVEGKSKFYKSNVPQADGWFEIKAAKGLRDIEWYLTTNEHSSLRWRRSHDAPLTYGKLVMKELDRDWETLEVIRYQAPLLFVKIVDEQGALLEGTMPEAKYKSRPESERSPTTYYVGGMQGDLGFEKQADGRWRSSCMLPEEETTVTVTKEGYVGEPKVVSLKEGVTEEVVIVMRKK